MLLVIDNYDSFTYNLVQYLGELGADVVVRRNDAVSVDEIGELAPSAIVLSPGPCTPKEAGVSVETIRRWGSTIPILGVCLGHQAIGEAYGGEVVLADRVMHGKTSQICHDGSGVFAGLPSPMEVMRYHSLIVERTSHARVARDHRRGAGRSVGGPRGEAPRASGVRRSVSSGVGDDAARQSAAQEFPGARAVIRRAALVAFLVWGGAARAGSQTPDSLRPTVGLTGLQGIAMPTYERVSGLGFPVGFDVAVPTLRFKATPLVTYRSQLGAVDPSVEGSVDFPRGITLDYSASRAVFTNDAWIRNDLINGFEFLAFGQDTRNYSRGTPR